MLKEEMTSEQLCFFVKEVFASIREINRRLDELKIVCEMESCTEDMKHEVRKRFTAMNDTKLNLIYSIYDIRGQFKDYFGNEKTKDLLQTTKLYSELKDL